MSSSILRTLTSDKLCHQFSLPVLQTIYPREQVAQILLRTRRTGRRARKLTPLLLVYLLIAWTLLPLMSLPAVFFRLTSALRWLASTDAQESVPTSAALCYRRACLGVQPLRLLLATCCRPLASPQTPGAFRFGLRLLALDGTCFDVPDTPANARTFGRSSDGRLPSPALEPPSLKPTRSPFPQVRCVCVAELGTHALLDAAFAPSRVPETALVPHLVSRLDPGFLLLLDRGFRNACLAETIQRSGKGHLLMRIQANEYTHKRRRLADGSWLVQIPRTADRPLQGEAVFLRVIEYRLAPEIAEPLSQQQASRLRSGKAAKPNPNQVYRLATTLLDPQHASARELAACYHERWEIELVFDEQKEHQQVQPRLSSKLPQGVLQECYALFLGHYAVRAWMQQAAAHGPLLDSDQLSFTHAVQVVGTALTVSASLAQVPLARWQGRVWADLRHPDRLLPPRRLRSYPRVVKAICTRFFVKRPKDVGFRVPDPHRCWQDYLLLI